MPKPRRIGLIYGCFGAWSGPNGKIGSGGRRFSALANFSLFFVGQLPSLLSVCPHAPTRLTHVTLHHNSASMTQPKLSSFFAPTKPAGGEKKRALEDESVDSASKKAGGGAEGETATTTTAPPPVKKAAVLATTTGKSEDGDAAAAAVASSSSLSASDLPEELATHPVMQSLARMDDGWRRLVVAQAKKPYFATLLKFLTQEANSKQAVYPPYTLVFNALTLCKWEDVRVVIIGQDPYHGPNQAHGLAFSVLPPTPPPPSLLNMFKEAAADVGAPRPSHGNLEAWSRQGVLLLNTVLTVRRGQAHSHKGKGWETFTDAVIKELNEHHSGLVFLLWGKPAQEKGKAVNRKKHRVIQCAHPSPLSATKTNQPFIGSKSFSRTNQALKELGKAEIDWRL